MTLLFLNSIGTGEVIFILLAVLMLFGAKSIPSLAKNLGRGIREVRTATDEIKRDLKNSALDMRKDLNVENPLKDIKKIIEEPGNQGPKDFKKDDPEKTLDPPSDSTPIVSNATKVSPTKKDEEA